MVSLLADLGIVCSRCQRLNQAAAQACVDCGQALTAVYRDAPTVPAMSIPGAQPAPAQPLAPPPPRPAVVAAQPPPPPPRPPTQGAQPIAPPPPAPKPSASPVAKPPPPPPRPAGPFGAAMPPGPVPPVPQAPVAARPPPPPPPRPMGSAPAAPPAAWVTQPAAAPSAPRPTPAPAARPPSQPIAEQPTPPPSAPLPPAEATTLPHHGSPPHAAAPAAAEKARPGEKAKVVVVRGTMPGSAFRLGSAPVGAGSSKGVMLFPEDPYLSPLHATFHFKDGKLFVRDEGGASGTFVRIRGPEILTSGGQFALGDHLVRFIGPLVPPATSGAVPYGAPVPPGALFSLEELFEGGRPGRACTRPGPVLAVGRAGCDLTFASDGLIQPRHCEVVVDAMGAILRDLSTPDGTYVRMAPGSERSLAPGDMVRFGVQVLRIDAG